MKRVLLAITVAWVLGLWAYSIGLAHIWGQSMDGDAGAVMAASAAALLVAVPSVYWPALNYIHRILKGYRPIVLFPIAAALLGIVPTAMIIIYWGGGRAALVSPEANLFYILFGVVGVVVGTAYAAFRNPTA